MKAEYLWQGCDLAAEVRDGEVADVFFAYHLEPTAQWSGRQKLIPVTDGAGALQEVYDATGALVWECTLDAYGNLLSESGRPPHPARFRGQFFDPETGFHYNFHRTYDPALCNYLTPDPLGVEGGSNFYAYPRNPLIWDDPSGLRCNAASFEKRMHKHFRSQGFRKISKKGSSTATGSTACTCSTRSWPTSSASLTRRRRRPRTSSPRLNSDPGPGLTGRTTAPNR